MRFTAKTSVAGMKTPLSLAVLVLSTASLSSADFAVENEAELQKLFASGTKIEKLADGFKFTEGPVWMGGADGSLIFSDIPANQLKKWTRGGVSTYREPSRNANGNTTDGTGRLVTAEHSGRQISRTGLDGTVATVVDRYEGKRFNSPNDVVVRSDGTFWFTDPPYGLPANEQKEQAGNYVYRFSPVTQRVTLLATNFDMPNGLCFSPNESKLYVADSGRPHHIRVFEVTPDGTLAKGQVFCTIDKGGPDGIRCDQAGRIWSSSGDGAQIFATDGSRIARILLPKGAANLCFGGKEGKTLFLTARDALYAVETMVRGAGK